MALVKFDKNTLAQGKGGYRISVNPNGPFTISPSVAQLMGLQVGDAVAFFQDDESGDWYLQKCEDGFALRHSKGSPGNLTFNNSAIAQRMLDGRSGGASYLVSQEPLEVEGEAEYAYCIVMSSGRDTRKKK